jgi:hypothetical protein
MTDSERDRLDDLMRPVREAQKWPPRTIKQVAAKRNWQAGHTADKLFWRHMADAKRTVKRLAKARREGSDDEG